MTKMNFANQGYEPEIHVQRVKIDPREDSIGLPSPPDLLPTPPSSAPRFSRQPSPSSTTLTTPESTGQSKVLRLNISGRQFVLPRKSLLRKPKTRLGALAKADDETAKNCCDVYLEDTNEFYFERNPYIFESILGYYRHGEFHVPDVCSDEVLKEMTYWRLKDDAVARCCKDQIPQFLWSQTGTLCRRNHRSWPKAKKVSMPRQRLWRILKKPWRTRGAMVFSCIGIFFIALIILTIILHSYPQFTFPLESEGEKPKTTTTPTATTTPLPRRHNHTRPPRVADYKMHHSAAYEKSSSDSAVLSILYCVCAVWFTLEYVLRVWAAPNRREFLKSPIGILDLVCIIPFYVDILLYVCARYNMVSHKAFTYVQMIQVLQIFRLIRYSTVLQFLSIAISKALREICLFIIITLVVTLFFGVLVYVAEQHNRHASIHNIPEAMYFAFITITTVGYGDLQATTAAGKVIAVITAFCGVVILAFPISLVVSQFSNTYEYETERRNLDKQRKKQSHGQAAAGQSVYHSFRSSMSAYSARGSLAPPLYDAAGFEAYPDPINLHRQPSYRRRRSQVAGVWGRTPFIIRRPSEPYDPAQFVNAGNPYYRNRRVSQDVLNAAYQRRYTTAGEGSYRNHIAPYDELSLASDDTYDSDCFEEEDEEDQVYGNRDRF